MSENLFTGRWILVSHEFRRSDGKVFYPWGEGAVGEVMFDGKGRFAAQIMRPDRPKFSPLPTDDEIKTAYSSYMAYFGRFEIVEEQKKLINHVEGALNPDWVGGQQIRYYEFKDGKMILRPEPIKAGEITVTGTLVWERAG